VAFEPVLPSPEDWLRDPAQSWGRLWQAFNFKLDQYREGVKQIPLLEGKLAGYEAALKRMPDSQARQNVAALLVRFRTKLGELKSQRGSLEGKVADALSQLRSEGSRLKQLPPAGQVGLAPIVGVALIGGAALVMYGITSWLKTLAGAIVQEKSVGGQIAAYAREQGLSAEQTQALLREAAKVPQPKEPGDVFASIADMLPWALGILAAVYFGPAIVGALTTARVARSSSPRRRAA